MGKIENKKSRIFTLVVTLLLCGSLLLSGCGNQTTEEQKKAPEKTAQNNKKEEEQTAEENEKEMEEIPSDLLPGQKADTEGNKDTKKQDEDNMEIVAEDGTVYTYEKSPAGNENSRKNTGHGSGTGNDNAGKTETGSNTDQDEVIQIHFSVDSSKADGSVSFAAAMTMDSGATVYDALATSGLSYSGRSYVTEIGGLGEKMFGSQSGWKYYVNGSAPGKSCTNYVLKDGDKVQWRYVLKP